MVGGPTEAAGHAQAGLPGAGGKAGLPAVLRRAGIVRAGSERVRAVPGMAWWWAAGESVGVAPQAAEGVRRGRRPAGTPAWWRAAVDA